MRNDRQHQHNYMLLTTTPHRGTPSFSVYIFRIRTTLEDTVLYETYAHAKTSSRILTDKNVSIHVTSSKVDEAPRWWMALYPQ
jgi:hypothetical protein